MPQTSNARYYNPNQMLLFSIGGLVPRISGHVLGGWPYFGDKNARHLWMQKIPRSSGHDQLLKKPPVDAG